MTMTKMTTRGSVLRAILATAAAAAAAVGTFQSPFPLPVSASPVHTIVGGQQAEPGHFPYFVDMKGCGGALIAPDIVLTAAHCEAVRYSTLHVGAYKKNEVAEGVAERTCETWVNSPLNSYARVSSYDIALCKLDAPVFIDESFVRLQINKDESFPAPGTSLIAIGMGGILEDTFGLMQESGPYLKNATLNTVITEQCIEDHDLSGLQVESIVCAETTEGSNVCFGDSGGPFLRRTYSEAEQRFVDTHVGAVSFGSYICATPGVGSGFARTSSVWEWIVSTSCNELESVAAFCNTEAPSETPSAYPSAASSASPSMAKTSKKKKKKTTKAPKTKSTKSTKELQATEAPNSEPESTEAPKIKKPKKAP